MKFVLLNSYANGKLYRQCIIQTVISRKWQTNGSACYSRKTSKILHAFVISKIGFNQFWTSLFIFHHYKNQTLYSSLIAKLNFEESLIFAFNGSQLKNINNSSLMKKNLQMMKIQRVVCQGFRRTKLYSLYTSNHFIKD